MPGPSARPTSSMRPVGVRTRSWSTSVTMARPMSPLAPMTAISAPSIERRRQDGNYHPAPSTRLTWRHQSPERRGCGPQISRVSGSSRPPHAAPATPQAICGGARCVLTALFPYHLRRTSWIASSTASARRKCSVTCPAPSTSGFSGKASRLDGRDQATQARRCCSLRRRSTRTCDLQMLTSGRA